MIQVLAICGSPHADGMCARMINATTNGAREAGAEVRIIKLSEMRIAPCRDCDESTCWEEMTCTIRDDGLELRRLVNECDALIVTAPVYFLAVNGLCKNFMDRMRYYGENGKPALAIAVAGGTGKGCIWALQELCRWMILLKFRPISPLPVTRYNFEDALADAYERGKQLVNTARTPSPYAGLSEQLTYYETLPFMKWGMMEEMAYLAQLAVEGLCKHGHAKLASASRMKVELADALFKAGKYEDGLRTAVAAQEESMHVFNRIIGGD